MPTRPTPIISAPTTPGRLAVLLFLLVGAGIAAAPAAFAVDDLTSPDASVTHGPSCRPGGVEIEVVAGTAPYSVVLATTRHPEGEDAATLAPGQTVVLRTGDVDWGETIDSRLEYAAQDGSGVTYVDELEPYSFTRPAAEDCAAITVPTDAGVPAPDGLPAPVVAPDGAPEGEPVPLPLPDPADGGSAPQDTGSGAPAPSSGGKTPSATDDGTDQGTDQRADDGTGLEVAPAAADRPVAPATQPPTWPALAAGVALLGSFCGVAVAGLRRHAAGRGGSGRGSA